MLAAHLQGLLKPSLEYGLRSYLSEIVVLEGMVANMSADSLDASIKASTAAIPALTPAGVKDTLRAAGPKLGRCTELRMMDIYRMSDRLRSKATEGDKSSPSLYQLYQIAEKKGIFAALEAHNQSADPET